jgi:hypothetical protein
MTRLTLVHSRIEQSNAIGPVADSSNNIISVDAKSGRSRLCRSGDPHVLRAQILVLRTHDLRQDPSVALLAANNQ